MTTNKAMKHADASCVILQTTTASEEDANRLARGLLEQRLAACVHLTPIRSLYRWQGAVEDQPEILLQAKTQAACAEAALRFVREHHPYELPELILLPIPTGLPAYLSWIQENSIPPAANADATTGAHHDHT